MPNDKPVLKSDLQGLKDFLMQQMEKLTNEVRDVSHAVETVDKRVSTLRES
jgi:hypothetical protein